MKNFILIVLSILTITSCTQKKQAQHTPPTFTGAAGEVKLITLDPGHFHAALIRKTSYNQISKDVYVYSPGGEDLKEHLARIDAYNARPNTPTDWNEIVYVGADFLEKMLTEQKGNVMVTSGNNRLKTDYIEKTLETGIHVLADKPMVINSDKFEELKACFEIAQQKGILLYDIMTERYEITNILQRELSLLPDIYGRQETGTAEDPAIEMKSVHHFYKLVSGKALTRPAWYYDTEQQGEALVDVSTHLVDLVQWECFPEIALDYRKDIKMLSARHWPTVMSKEQFKASTGLDKFPEYLRKDIKNDSLYEYQNGEINYQLKGIHAKLTILWNFEAPAGTGDVHYSRMSGSKADLVILQDKAQHYKPELYIYSGKEADAPNYEKALERNFQALQSKYPGIELEKTDDPKGWHVLIPESYRVGHEAHFGQVTQNFLRYLVDGKLPDWEVPNMIAKYFVTTQALKMAKGE